MFTLDNIYFINLDKDKQRLENVVKQCFKITSNPSKIVRIPAVYGKTLTIEQMKNIVNIIYAHIGSKSAIGIAMSHIKMWKAMIENNDQYALFLEDDAIINDDFNEKFKNIDIPKDFYILYLGCTVGCDVNKNYDSLFSIIKLIQGDNIKKVEKVNDNVYIPALPLALHGYILSNQGARYLVDCFAKDKIYHHVDYQLMKYLRNVPSYAVTPQLILQDNKSVSTSNNVDNNYPAIINNTLLLNRYSYSGEPYSYIFSIHAYDILGYKVNLYTTFFLLIGLSLGYSTDFLKFIIVILSFNLAEIGCYGYSKKIEQIVGNSIIALVGFIISKFIKKLISFK